LALLAVNSAEAEKTDVIILDNGDRITGEIKKLERGQLKYSTDAMSTVYAEWDHVISIRSIHNFRVRLEDGTLYYGTLGEPSDSLTVLVVTPADSIPIQRDDVVGITPVHASFWDRMDGSLSLGLNYTQATGIGQLTFDYRNSYQTERNYLDFQWKLNFTGQDKEEASRYQDLSLTYERELKKRKWYGAASVGLEQNDELGIALRLPANMGWGLRVLQTNHDLLTALAGLSINAEWATGSDSATINLEGLLTTGFQFFRYDSPKSDITTNLTLYPSLSNWGRIRLNFSVSLRHELISDFFVDLSFWDNYDSDPPSADPDAATNDWALTSSIGWSY
jgi:hypothetical protein